MRLDTTQTPRGSVNEINAKPSGEMEVRTTRFVLSVSATVGIALSALVHANDADDGHAVFVMTNDAESNEVIAFQRNPYGTLFSPHRFKTEGRGSGGQGDPLASQGSLTLSQDHQWLFAVNAGSGTLSVFRVLGASLFLTDRTPAGGAEPTSVAQHGSLVYVLNAAGSSSVVGFEFNNGHLREIPDSQRFLSANGANPGSLAFTPDGKFLIATEKTSNRLDTFAVLPNGQLSAIKVTPSVGPGAFAAIAASNGTVIVSETGSGGTTSAQSSYRIQTDGTLVAVSASLPTLGAANCWNAITPNGRFVYASNAGSSTLAGFSIGNSGALTALPGTLVGTNPTGSGNLDIAISVDGKFLYSLNSANGTIGAFAVNVDGSLTNLGTVGGLPAKSSLNGIAAN
jgi:6-phosphogluconolactonase (cycloisomerase 2 family)